MVQGMIRSLLVLAVIAGGGRSAFAVEPIGDFNLRDLLHTVQARRTLAEDPALAPLNLGIEVRGGVAILWGPVPSVDLAFRAEARLRALIEVIDVHNNLEITPDPLGPAPIFRGPPQFLPDRLPPPLPEAPRPPQILL